MPETVAKTLDRFELLKPLAPAERGAVERQCRWQRFDAQEQIFDRLDESRDVYFVADGRVRVVNFSASGREISFIDLGAGTYFGELAALDAQPRSASVVAMAPTLLAAMPSKVFCRVVSEHPALALMVMQNLAKMVRRSTERIMELSTLGANNRVHAEILRLARANPSGGKSAVIAPIPTHSDIASRVSTTRETVARVFSDLARCGILERRPDQLLVRDVARIEQLVEDVQGGA